MVKRVSARWLALKPRRVDSHKGENGRVLVVGGSERYVGSPGLVGLAALRAGADLVTVVAPQKVAWAINAFSPDLITVKLSGDEFSRRDVKHVLDLAKSADVVVLGNGIEVTKGTAAFMKRVVSSLRVPLVLDAGALHVVDIKKLDQCVLLPHGAELAALLDSSGMAESVLQKNLRSNVLVKKGYPITHIFSREKSAVSATGNAGMTHGGCGDVLAGIVAGLIAQGNDAFLSCRAAAFVNGVAANRLARTYGVGFLASDLLGEVPRVLQEYRKFNG